MLILLPRIRSTTIGGELEPATCIFEAGWPALALALCSGYFVVFCRSLALLLCIEAVLVLVEAISAREDTRAPPLAHIDTSMDVC